MLSNIDKKCAVAFFELYTEAFAKVAHGTNKYREPSRFPAIDIDLTFVADVSAVSLPAGTETAKGVGELLEAVKVQDIYVDADGVSALTLRFAFVSADRTLTKQEIQPATDAICTALESLNLKLKA